MSSIFSNLCQVFSSLPTKHIMNSSMSICHKIVHDSTTLLYTMLTNLPLHCSESFFKFVATDHHIFCPLKLNQICPRVCSIFKSNSTSLHGDVLLKQLLNQPICHETLCTSPIKPFSIWLPKICKQRLQIAQNIGL